MDDTTYTFISDIKERKSAASGARHVKNGSKSKKCTLPSDYLTRSQKQKLNGEVKTYKMSEPITWKEFQKMPKDLKEDYIVNMIDTYHVSCVQLGEMMGISNKTLNNYLRDLGLNGYLPGRGHCMSRDQRDAWNRFLNDYATAGKNQPVSKRTEEYYQKAEEKAVAEKKSTSNLPENASKFSINYSGGINLMDVYNFLKIALGEKFIGNLEITFNK